MLTAGSAPRAIAALDRERVHVVLLDVCLGEGGSSLDVAAHALGRAPMPRVLAMSGQASRAELFALTRLGVCGYHEKGDPPPTLAELMSERGPPATALAAAVKPLVGQRLLADVVDEVRAAMRDEALARHDHNLERASRALGVSRRGLQKRRGSA